nr:hypothetical protein [Tanacetum cinerariifolium]
MLALLVLQGLRGSRKLKNGDLSLYVSNGMRAAVVDIGSFDLLLPKCLEEEAIEVMMETMEQYMSKTHGDYGSSVTRPKIDGNAHFELKGKYLKELRDNTFSGSEHEDANEHIEKVLETIDLFDMPN